jgi:phytoene/squalene synthetase
MRKEVSVVVVLALTLYREILAVIEENQYDVYTKRACVNFFRKVAIYFKIILFGYPQPQLHLSYLPAAPIPSA